MKKLKHKTKSVKIRNDVIPGLSLNLQDWFLKHARNLPWRRLKSNRPDPYKIWLSEIMLQQTQVSTVIPYFNRFIERFPKMEALAKANLDEVYALWAGLGYYSRARHLHRGAISIQNRLEKKMGFPSNRDEWLAIPGVGPYTAGAICSIAHNQREAIVDGNVVRVLSRIFALEKDDSQHSRIWSISKKCVDVPEIEPRLLNQALMELGALICKPKNPLCHECPVQMFCKGKKNPDRYPAPKQKKAWKKIQEEHWILTSQKEIFLVQNETGKWRKGLWDFPVANAFPLSGAKWVREEISRYVVTRHQVVRRQIIFELDKKKAKSLQKYGKWFDPKTLPGVPAPVRKMIAKLSGQ